MVLYTRGSEPVSVKDDLYAIGLKEVEGDLFLSNYKNIVIPTNGVIRSDGGGVLGAGVAKQYRDRVPGAEEHLGIHLLANGNVFGRINEHEGKTYWAFPTKDHWRDGCVRGLVIASAVQMGEAVNDSSQGWVMPRVGTGYGGVPWSEIWVDLVDHLSHPKVFVVKLSNLPSGRRVAELDTV